MDKQVMLVFAVMALTAIALGAGTNCTSTCKDYSACTSLTNATSMLSNSLLCSKEKDAAIGVLFHNTSSCALTDAAIEVADLLNITWDGVASIEAIMQDHTFWKKECKWSQLAAAACIYFSVPPKDTCTNINTTVVREDLFCPGECMSIASSCFNLDKYRQLSGSLGDFCKGVTVAKTSSNCYKGQVDQTGLSAPACTELSTKTTNLTGPYIVAGIALALAVVGLIGLALITCKSGNGAGVPNSF